ncbi:MAG: hypothetical protein IKO27_03135 [Ruminococcus sp.]|nr:hypothetical protein [Ruminococcus sp.]
MFRVKIIIAAISVIGFFMGAIGLGDTIKIMKDDITDFKTVDKESAEVGDLVRGDIDASFGQIAVQKTTRKYGFIPMGSSETPYYLVYFNNHYAVVSAGNKDVQTSLDKLADQSRAILDNPDAPVPTPVNVTTKVIAMPDKVKQYLKECFDEWGLTTQDYLELVDESCVFNCVQYDSMKFIPFIGFGVGALFLIIFIILMIKTKKPKTVYVNDPPMMM